MKYEIANRDGMARCGCLTTPHGSVRTPAFMPVGTNATVKMLTPEMLRQTGTEMILANAYHLNLRPGTDVVERLGGLHKFMNWPGPILTDSGGFQVFSLAKLRKVTDDGVEFQSHIDGNTLMMTPERTMEIEAALGADIIMTLDECTPYPVEREASRKAVERTVEWAGRCRAAHRCSDQALFGIVQGSTYREQRKDCARRLVDLDFDGYATGGLSVGEGPDLMCDVLSFTTPELPEDKPRYLMGVGSPEDIVRAVGLGIDMFDCVMPTRNARNACAFTTYGKVRLRNAKHSDDSRPLDEHCECPVCRQYSRAYLRHLFKSREALASILTSQHNVWFYQHLMQGLRSAIARSELQKFSEQFIDCFSSGDETQPRMM